MEYVYGILSEDPFDDNTRETVCGILMEALTYQFDVDGVAVCDSLFALLDFDKQQQQLDTTIANTPPIEIPPTDTILPNIKKTPT